MRITSGVLIVIAVALLGLWFFVVGQQQLPKERKSRDVQRLMVLDRLRRLGA